MAKASSGRVARVLQSLPMNAPASSNKSGPALYFLLPLRVERRAWGPEQATGAPDTMIAGDQPTAWAPLQQDGGAEWLRLEFGKTVEVAEVRIRETFNPGAIQKVLAIDGGMERPLWEGVEEIRGSM